MARTHSSSPYRASTALHRKGEHGPEAAPPCPQACCTHTPPTTFYPLSALQDLLSTKEVPALLYRLAARYLPWKRAAPPQAGGVHPWSFLFRERFEDIHSPYSPQVTMTPKSCLLTATYKHMPNRAAVYEATYLLHFTLCTSVGVKIV